MNAQEILAQIDHAITEIDLVLHQWQEDLDMMSFIGSNAQFEMWTNDDPPQIIAKDALDKSVGKEVRVMHHVNGEWTQIGTATIEAGGKIRATITEDVPELRAGMTNGVSIDQDGEMKPLPAIPMHPPFEGLNKPLTIRGLHEAIARAEARADNRFRLLKSGSDLENHPFFKNKEQ